MPGVDLGSWPLAGGVGMLWLGAQILWVAGVPWLVRRGPAPTAEPGSAQAFLLFWLEQYRWIGAILSVLGLLPVLAGVLQVAR